LLSRTAEAVMKKIIVGIDLSAQSERALGHAIDVARHHDAEVVMVLVDAVPEMPAVVDPSSVALAAQYTRTLAERLAADRKQFAELRARWQGHGATLSSVVVDGHPDDRLTAVATELGADLIVVGSHGRTGIRRWLAGSVAERVVRHATQSVLVARGEAPSGGYQRVVIGTDFSPSAERAFEHAIPMLAPTARVDVVHGWSGPWSMPEAAMLAYESMYGTVKGMLAEATQRITAMAREQGRPAVRVEGKLAEAAGAFALTEAASNIHADLVVVGSHGRRGVRRWIVGSVAEVTVRHAPCSVLVSR
jgi:nucleotide-binding universal stress UspA family protein